jgi:hypothetical protein
MLCQIYIIVQLLEIEDNQCDFIALSHSVIFLSLESHFSNSFKKEKTFGSEVFRTAKHLQRTGG